MYRIKLQYEKFDFNFIQPEEYLTYFGYKNPKHIGNYCFLVECLGIELPSVKVIDKNEEKNF